MTDDPLHPAAWDPDRLLRECDVRYSKAGGPGGQHRNKVETAVTLHHRPTGIWACASERRERTVNHSVALFRLRTKLATEVRQPVELVSYAPSPLWRQRCRKDGTLSINPAHRDLPAVLAEAMDIIAGCNMDLRAASVILRTTPTQLVKLLKAVPPAFQWLNHRRKQRGLNPLK